MNKPPNKPCQGKYTQHVDTANIARNIIPYTERQSTLHIKDPSYLECGRGAGGINHSLTHAQGSRAPATTSLLPPHSQAAAGQSVGGGEVQDRWLSESSIIYNEPSREGVLAEGRQSLRDRRRSEHHPRLPGTACLHQGFVLVITGLDAPEVGRGKEGEGEGSLRGKYESLYQG